MKKNKIIGLFVAVAGVVASISVASALYVRGAESTGFGIGAKYHTDTGTINYLINDAASGTVTPEYLKTNGENHGPALSGEYTQAHYSFPLGASFSSDVPTQSYVVGNFKVDLKNVDPGLQNKAKIWVCVNGYTDNTYGKTTYATCFMSADEMITGATKTVKHDIAVAVNNTQKVDVYVKLDTTATFDFPALNEGKAFDIEVSWGAPESYEFAYVVGGSTGWDINETYTMVPNINKENKKDDQDHYTDETVFEWMFNNLPGSMGKAKCKKGDTWSADPDADLNPAKTYDVYWSGNSSSAASFVEKTA